MKSPLPVLALLALALPVSATLAAEKAAPAEKSAEAPKRHPLRGVITRVDAERSALMVKHEEIPGVMRAMTMQFKVDAATLKTAKVGDAITGLMSRQGGDWVLENVKAAEAKKN